MSSSATAPTTRAAVPTPQLPCFPDRFWDLVRRSARRTPEAPMLADDLGRSLTVGQYEQASRQTAAALARQHGIGRGDVVTWQLPTTLEAAVVMGALSSLGAVQNPIIPMLRHRDVRFITGQVGSSLLIVPGPWRGFDFPAMAEQIAAVSACEVVVVDHLDGPRSALGLALPSDPLGPDPVDRDPLDGAVVEAGVADHDRADRDPLDGDVDATRWIYYSSGTTADPKGVRHSDASVMHGATGMISVLGLSADDVYPVAFPLAHIGGMSALTTQLMTGALLVLSDGFDVERSPRFMASVRPTLLGSAIPFFRAYLAAQREAGAEPLFPTLRACVNGGAPRTLALHREVRDTLGGVGILSAWGLTEFPIATFGAPTDSDEQIAGTEGRPVPGVTVRAVDPHGVELPPGHEGELVLEGPQRCLGYVDPALDVDAFDGRGRLRTGDLGVVEPTGHVRITGRAKDVIIRNAENLSALEMETALQQHPDVADVAVIGLPDDRTGEQACAVLVTVTGRPDPTLADLAEHCRALGLPNQKIPERVVVVDALPRNTLGKVLKRELRDRYTAAVPS